MKSLDTLLAWALLGSLLSAFQLVFSPWMIHFVPVITVLHTLYILLVFITAGVICQLPPGAWRSRSRTICWGLIAIYFTYWFATHSIIAHFGTRLSWLLALTLSLVLVRLSTRLFDDLNRLNLTRWTLLVPSIALIFLLKVGSVWLLPAETLITYNSVKSPRQAMTQPNPLGVTDVLYPFSVFPTTALSRYRDFLELSGERDFVVVLIMDAFRADYLGKTFGGESITPNLDRFAERYQSFPQYRVQSNWTKPSTASLFTGKYPTHHGTFHSRGDTRSYKGQVLPDRFRTLGERFRSKHYQNFGAVMSPHISSRYNYDQGFDVWLSVGKGFQDDHFTLNQALFWVLKTNPSRAFLYLHIKGPHHPFRAAYANQSFWKKTPYFEAGEYETESRYKFKSTDLVGPIQNGEINLKKHEVTFLRHLYGAQVNYYDRHFVQSFLSNLKQLDVFQSSLTVITSDHGEELYDHGSYAHGKTLYEENIHTPLLMKFPNGTEIANSSRQDLMVESIDLSATLADYAGGSLDGITGHSLLPVLQGGTTEKQTNSFKEAYSQNLNRKRIQQTSIVKPPWKLIYHYSTGKRELYNLREDPHEQNPLDQNPKLKDRLQKRIFETTGSDSVPEVRTNNVREATSEEKKQLKGLGYISD